LQDIAPGLLFFSGGAGSVRGQPYQSLGIPVGGSTAGGRSFLAASAELRGYVTDKISLVGFYDVGMVDSDSFVSGSSSRHAGAGIGLRYDLGGLGPLRLDLAQPVSGSTGNGLQFYLGIGQAF
jgi:translocation and assembly module TamA